MKPKRHRARLLNRETQTLLNNLKGYRWGIFFNNQDIEIEGVNYHCRVGKQIGQYRIAVMAAGQFLAIKTVTDPGLDFIRVIYEMKILNPRKFPYGWDPTWYFTWGGNKEVERIKNTLIIEEPDETPDDHT